jgi:hypothetical protein
VKAIVLVYIVYERKKIEDDENTKKKNCCGSYENECFRECCPRACGKVSNEANFLLLVVVVMHTIAKLSFKAGKLATASVGGQLLLGLTRD